MAPILFFGASGTVGTALQSHCQQRKLPFVGLRHSDLDISDQTQIKNALDQHQPKVVINAAAMTTVDACETEQAKAFLINATAPTQIAEACKQRKIQFVHLGTDYVFDGKKKTPYLETDPVHPLGIYAQSKAEGEIQVGKINPQALVIRVAWVFGNGGKNFMCRMRQLIQTQEELKVANDRQGSCTYAPDLVTGIFALLERKANGLFHFVNEGSLSWYDFGIKLLTSAKRFGIPVTCKVIHPISSSSLQLPAPRPNYSVLDTSKYRSFTGNQIRPWQETLFDFLDQTTRS